ncbi:hypothetical protein E2F50_03785 [Rhizobium deserti]|uniref:Integrase catalytic domain-containing protein n=1 Tax=Rhizobium deserti TaxID=2547961 RepID=A0A4R5UND8_9HYPH|nr:DDE-type integrase/transposase/recombinase [Rhizobium deserti]TDK39254.1 hypothetical protein E2F50_03785 [Rhizobium deserti]
MSQLPMQPGQTFRIRSKAAGEGAIFDFKERLRSGRLVFVNQTTGRTRTIDENEFELMRGVGNAALLRYRFASDQRPREHIEPAMLADPNNQKLTNKQRAAAEAASVKYEKARAVLFFIRKWDEAPEVADSRRPVEALTRRFRNEAAAQGITWLPSYSTLHRARRIGQPGQRTLAMYLGDHGVHDPEKRYPPFVLEAKQAAIDFYWSERGVEQLDAISRFFELFDIGVRKLVAAGLKPPKRVDRTTVRLWILKAETYERHCKKYGRPSADRQFHGSSPSIDAEHALQYVMIDHTRCDQWAIVLDEDGNEIFRERPWIVAAVDVYSELVLSLILTLEPPSLTTVTACLKQVMKPKNFLLERYGEYKGATTGWGAPFYLVVDNGWENVGKSFQTGCESLGIRVKWAPVKTGEYKTFVEHLFHVLNKQVWHKGDGAVPFKPSEMSALQLKPREEATRTVAELEALGWDYLVTRHNLEDCRRRRMARARAWSKSLEKVGRNILDDVSALDRALGAVDSASLTRDGVLVDGHRFHDAALTGRLLDSLVRHAPPSRQPRSRLRGATIPVQVVKDPTDCSFVNVWDFAAKEYVRLPNVDRRFSSGLSWHGAGLIKDFARKVNAAFHSDEEKLAARSAFTHKLSGDIAVLPFAEQRKAVRIRQRELERAPGDIVEAYAEPSPMGMSTAELPNGMAAVLQAGNRIPSKGVRRGRPKKAGKTQRSDLRAAHPKAGVAAASTQQSASPRPTTPCPTRENYYVVSDSKSLLDDLAKDLD